MNALETYWTTVAGRRLGLPDLPLRASQRRAAERAGRVAENERRWLELQSDHYTEGEALHEIEEN